MIRSFNALSKHSRQISVFTDKTPKVLTTAILDWSGTTLDYGVYAPAVVFIDVFDKYGVPISMTEAREPMGLHKKEHIRKITENSNVIERWTAKYGKSPTSEDVDNMFKDFVPMQLACLHNYSDLIDGTVDSVNFMKALNMKIGSTTGFTKEMSDILATDAAKQGYVPDTYVSADEVPVARPEPYMVLENMKRLGEDDKKCVVKIDDTIAGIQEGLNANVWTVGIAETGTYMGMTKLELNGNKRKNETEHKKCVDDVRVKLTDAGAHYVINTIADLPNVINIINIRLSHGETPTDL